MTVKMSIWKSKLRMPTNIECQPIENANQFRVPTNIECQPT